jgi:putative (di)nucleoside polyphosphate hydrolase
VAVAVFNAAGHVFMGKRVDNTSPYAWQMPQGGIDAGEDPYPAALRELYEETGIRSVSLLAEMPDWITYDFPPELLGTPVARGFAGQRQKWFAMRFTGTDDEINLAAHGEPEFETWRWVPLAETLDIIVPFKRPVYNQVIAAFDQFGNIASSV